MDRNSRIILRNTMRFLSNKGYKMITEFALPNKKRVDLIGINREKKIIIIEVKSNFMSIKKDKKWENYLNYCNLFYFALSEVPEKFKFKIINTPLGNISEPILITNGILFFKVRDKRTFEKFVDIEEIKNQLVNDEKTKILNMHSKSHYDNLKRSVAIKFY